MEIEKVLHMKKGVDDSSYATNSLIQVPRGLVNENGDVLNKGNICVAKTSPPEVHKAYYEQFKKDFALFLRSRSREMVFGGRMVLIFLGSSNSSEPDSLLELLGSTLHDLVLKGVIEPEKLDKFNMPFYNPTVEEVRQLVEAEMSFALNKLETFTIGWSMDTSQNLETRAKFAAKSLRVVTETLLETTFSHVIMDGLFRLFETRIKERIVVKNGEYVNIVLSVTKKE